jgi:hypothetical protein
VPAVQLPPWQLSIDVHELLVLQGVPSATDVVVQPWAGSHEGAWQMLLLVHVMAAVTQAPPVHVPDATWHLSGVVVHEVLSAFWQLPFAPQAWQVGQPLLVQQTLSVQNSPDVHSSGVWHDAPGGFLPQVLPTQVLG